MSPVRIWPQVLAAVALSTAAPLVLLLALLP